MKHCEDPRRFLYLPAAQGVHVSDSYPLKHWQSLSLSLPSGDVARFTGKYMQSRHVVAQTSGEYLPASHKRQFAELGLPRYVEYLPTPHGTQVDRVV